MRVTSTRSTSPTRRRRAAIVIKKTGFEGNLEGAVFTLWIDNFPYGSLTGIGPEDDDTGTTCTSLANGTCTFDDVLPGFYWLEETTAGDGHYTVDPVAVEVPFGSGVRGRDDGQRGHRRSGRRRAR